MTKYVCGFAFTKTDALVLINNRRGLYKGLLNGPGGAIRDDEAEGIRAAMHREFLEETGVDVSPNEWSIFHHERFRNRNEVYYLTTRLNPWDKPSTQKEGQVLVLDNWRSIVMADRAVLADGLSYLAPMAHDMLERSIEMRPL